MQYVVGSNVLVFVILLFVISKFSSSGWSVSQRTFLALAFGGIFGSILHCYYAAEPKIIEALTDWFSVVGYGYLRLLQMLLIPLVFISILTAVSDLENIKILGRIGILNICVLLITTLISAAISVLVSHLFGLTAEGLVQGPIESQRLEILHNKATTLESFSVPELLLSFFPHNLFADLSGAYPTSVISILIVSSLLGVVVIKLQKEDPTTGTKIREGLKVFQIIMMKLVRLVISFTPYGVMALITVMILKSELASMSRLAIFIVASYVAISLMFVVHSLLLILFGVNVFKYFQKVFPVLSIAFVTRSSAASIPLTIKTLTEDVGVSKEIAGFSAPIGSTVGQNGCAGIYPAMLASMIAPTLGINVLDPNFFFPLIFIVMFTSFGVAGVGGGATFSALIVLPILGFPVTLIALLISIEPIIDMGRTALNVNGSMVSSVLTARLLQKFDEKLFMRK